MRFVSGLLLYGRPARLREALPCAALTADGARSWLCSSRFLAEFPDGRNAS
tara:strand:+ start:144 stop:296 length:153 start_codon:yes stop_codon:yes gene_type:complete